MGNDDATPAILQEDKTAGRPSEAIRAADKDGGDLHRSTYNDDSLPDPLQDAHETHVEVHQEL